MSKEVKENSPIRDLPITGVKLCSNSQGLSCQERPVLAEIEINKSPETEMINSAQIDKEKPQKTERNETNPPVKDDIEKEGSETQNPAPCLTLSEVKESKTQREQKVIEKIPETPPSKQPQSPLTYQQGQKAKVDMPLVCKQTLEKMSLGLESYILKQEKKQFKEEQRNLSISEIIQVSRGVVNYRQLFPGEIAEENLEVVNNSSTEVKYKVHVICDNEELASLEEYVFSMRKTGGYDYNDKYLITQSAFVKSCYKIALKVPNFRTKEILNGRIEIFSDEVKGRISIPLSSKVCLPILTSKHMLHFVNEAHPTLNFLIKTLRKQDFKLILVNKAARTITVDFEVIMDEFMKANFDLKVSPGQKVYYPQSIITVGLLLQQKHSSRVDRVENMRALVVGKVRECSVKFTYPCVFQQQTGNVSGVDAE